MQNRCKRPETKTFKKLPFCRQAQCRQKSFKIDQFLWKIFGRNSFALEYHRNYFEGYSQDHVLRAKEAIIILQPSSVCFTKKRVNMRELPRKKYESCVSIIEMEIIQRIGGQCNLSSWNIHKYCQKFSECHTRMTPWKKIFRSFPNFKLSQLEISPKLIKTDLNLWWSRQ